MYIIEQWCAVLAWDSIVSAHPTGSELMACEAGGREMNSRMASRREIRRFVNAYSIYVYLAIDDINGFLTPKRPKNDLIFNKE